MDLKKFLAELKRRNVYRAAVVYGMAAWLLAHSTLGEAITAAIAAAVGLMIYLGYRLVRYNREQVENKKS